MTLQSARSDIHSEWWLFSNKWALTLFILLTQTWDSTVLCFPWEVVMVSWIPYGQAKEMLKCFGGSTAYSVLQCHSCILPQGLGKLMQHSLSFICLCVRVTQWKQWHYGHTFLDDIIFLWQNYLFAENNLQTLPNISKLPRLVKQQELYPVLQNRTIKLLST